MGAGTSGIWRNSPCARILSGFPRPDARVLRRLVVGGAPPQACVRTHRRGQPCQARDDEGRSAAASVGGSVWLRSPGNSSNRCLRSGSSWLFPSLQSCQATLCSRVKLLLQSGFGSNATRPCSSCARPHAAHQCGCDSPTANQIAAFRDRRRVSIQPPVTVMALTPHHRRQPTSLGQKETPPTQTELFRAQIGAK